MLDVTLGLTGGLAPPAFSSNSNSYGTLPLTGRAMAVQLSIEAQYRAHVVTNGSGVPAALSYYFLGRAEKGTWSTCKVHAVLENFPRGLYFTQPVAKVLH